MLRKGQLAQKLNSFITNVNKLSQDDASKAITTFCNEFENDIYEAIRSITITIQPSEIKVIGSPTTQTNLAPIVLIGSIT